MSRTSTTSTNQYSFIQYYLNHTQTPISRSNPPEMLLFPKHLVTLFIFLITLASAAAVLPPDEVEALQQVARALGKRDWDFSVDPCSGESGWKTRNPKKGEENAVTCNCSFANNTVCHVVSIVLKSQNLAGTVPKELVRLPYLQDIDLTRNYLNGTIPPEWGSMQLVNISLLGNRVTGQIPKELANISTLVNLTLEFNQLSGDIPQELGDLPLIEKIHLTSNNFTGELPRTLSKLTTLKDFRIVDNNFTGSIPTFIESWTNLEKLAIQGSGLSGPIPSGIRSLTKLTDLRISDLNGQESSFPFLGNATNIQKLILRSCNIVGQLPDYLGSLTTLKVLDLSFNKLTGPIPSSFSRLFDTDYIYLTGNFLTGQLPDWMLKEGQEIDLSYNNLTLDSSESPNCQPRKLNLFASSSNGNRSGDVSCLGSPCLREYYSLHINCGGGEVRDDGTSFEADLDSGGPSNFFRSKTNWAFSSTGHFLDDDRPVDSYIPSANRTQTTINSSVCMDARISPLSLTYYGFCLKNGNYTVNLHFAEIAFTDDLTYNSLGRRLFDIHIQGNLVKKDFNIEDEAGGVNKPIIKRFPAVVTDKTLNIRFYWAGKGTTGIPSRGVYGPLVSAISVNPDYPLPSENVYIPSENGNSLSAGAIAGIVIAVLFGILLVLGILWWKGCLGNRNTMEQDLKGLDLHTGSFSLRQIRAATNNFDPANKIGEGGFGCVYKGLLADGTVIAVKQLSSKSKQGNREFVNEIGMISALQHPHLVKLYGCCIEANQLLLVYEYMENNSLARALFGSEELQLKLDWTTRHRICVGIARGLAYLHVESRLKVVHRDIKATNVLLDTDLVPKISDFGLAKLDEEENTHISTRIAGTYGYMAPEYAMHGYLTDKADVYSFGIVVLEIVSGRSNTSIKRKEDCFYLLDWARVLNEKGNLMELVDPRLGSDVNKREVVATIKIALLCTDVSPAARPNMSAVVSMLEGRAAVQEYQGASSDVSSQKMKIEQMISELEDSSLMDGQVQTMSIDVPWTASTSTSDLYPVTLDTDFLQKRV